MSDEEYFHDPTDDECLSCGVETQLVLCHQCEVKLSPEEINLLKNN